MSRSAALENADQGIRVNIISPGLTYTPLLKNDPGFDIEFGAFTRSCSPVSTSLKTLPDSHEELSSRPAYVRMPSVACAAQS
jgi:NAD(P)-dependent dehydrogenase (short-subunit alcohol dehydrogenase family)